MPTHNQGAFIRDAILSVLSQQEANYELIVYDALSDDETPSILAEFKVDKRIQWIREADRGQIDALNKGLSVAKGEVLCWLNSDDVFLPHALRRISNAWKKCPELDFVYGDALDIDQEGNVLYPNLFTENPVAERYLGSHNFICQPTCFFTRELWERTGPLSEDFPWTFDYSFFAKFFVSEGKGIRLKSFLAANRHYPDTKTNSGLVKRYFEQMRLYASWPGRALWLRRSFRIYSLEVLIKVLETWKSDAEVSVMEAFAKSVLPSLHRTFLNLVSPCEQAEIAARFQEWLSSEGGLNLREWMEESSV